MVLIYWKDYSTSVSFLIKPGNLQEPHVLWNLGNITQYTDCLLKIKIQESSFTAKRMMDKNTILQSPGNTVMFQKYHVKTPTSVEHSHLVFNDTWKVCSSSCFPNSFSKSVKSSGNYDVNLYCTPTLKFTAFPKVFLKYLYTYTNAEAVVIMTQLTFTYISWSIFVVPPS